MNRQWRKGLMRNHSSEHLFFSAVKRINPNAKLGYIWIDGTHGTAEIQVKDPSLDLILQAEREVQQIIDENIDVRTTLVDASKIDEEVRAREGVYEKEDKVRIVEFEGYDRSACSGIHVMFTGEIQFFKVIDYRLTANETKVEFVTGFEAARMTSEVFNDVLSRKHDYPFEYEQLGVIIDRSKELIEDYKCVHNKAEELLVKGPIIREADGISLICHYLPGFDLSMLRKAIGKAGFEKPTALFLFVPEAKSSFIFATYSLPQKASEYISEEVIKHGGKGGGSDEAYNGGFTNVEKPEDLYESLVTALMRNLHSNT